MLKKTRFIPLVALFAVLTALGAYIFIPLPFTPVPITLQTLFVYLSGDILGGYLGALSQVIYILLGISGLPVFARGRGGIEVLIGPTGGYLIGFIAAAFIIGKLAKLRSSPAFIWFIFSNLIGTIIIYGIGVFQLSIWVGSFKKAVMLGVFPFLIGDLIKVWLAAYIATRNQIMKIIHLLKN
ncbi:MAG: biotin transporter BioY [Candidatus Bathyarchaeia archaeon]|nr:biotin transporter BioY [Candidatus Bathyarchaeota archaeon]